MSWFAKAIGIPGLKINTNNIRNRSCYGASTYRNEAYGDELAYTIRLQAILLWVFGWIPIIGNVAAWFILNTTHFAVSTMDKWLVC